jgi:omega-6 fatty acid desaturase (delta-12 desaturase)
MVVFEKADYSRIQKQLRSRPSLLPTLGVVALDVAILCAVSNLSGRGWVCYFAAQALIALLCFHSFALLHECGHGSATPWRWLNVVLGHCASILCFIPFYPWKYIHLKHHTWAGHLENDPTLRSLRTFRDQGTPALARAGWRSWIPISALLQHVVYLGYPLRMYRAGELTSRRLMRSAASVLWMLAAYTAIYEFAPAALHPRSWALGVALYLITEELVNLPHHVGMPTSATRLAPWDQHRVTRSCYYPIGLSEFFVLNFNFHIEHHLFPSLPWYRLRAARKLLVPALGEGYDQAVGVEWNVRNRRRGLDEIVAGYRQTIDHSRS